MSSLKSVESSTLSGASEVMQPLSLRSALEFLVHRRWWIVIPSAAALVITAVVMLLTPNRYVSSATILPSGQGEGVSSLKDLVGLGSIGMVDENSSQLYPLILHSQQIKGALLQRTYAFSVDGTTRTMSLPEYFKETDPTRLSRALDDITTISTGRRTGELVLQVETMYPELSQTLARAYLEELENFNRFKRATSAGSNQRYLDKQLTATTAQLDSAEERLERFRRVNSDWAATTDAPTLTQLGRMQREVEMQSTALVYLRQQYEAARLTAQKDVPIVRILDSPNLPTLKSGPPRTRICLLAALLTALASIGSLFAHVILRELLATEVSSPAISPLPGRLILRQGGIRLRPSSSFAAPETEEKETTAT